MRQGQFQGTNDLETETAERVSGITVERRAAV